MPKKEDMKKIQLNAVADLAMNNFAPAPQFSILSSNRLKSREMQ